MTLDAFGVTVVVRVIVVAGRVQVALFSFLLAKGEQQSVTVLNTARRQEFTYD